MKYIFGPVLSRRFGTSLGVDLSFGKKQCNYDCLYCELEPSLTTSIQTLITPVDEVVNELKQYLNPNIDIITITANGEPTLYPHLDDLVEKIDKIKGKTQTLILTNSSTLPNKQIFQTLLKFDQVKLSLDSVSENIFKKLDRPSKEINLQNIIESIIKFSSIYKGKLFIEILVVKNINDSIDEIKKINHILMQIQNIARVDFGTIDRPPAYGVLPLEHSELFELSLNFDKTLPIHIVSRIKLENKKSLDFSKDEILNTLHKRALSQDDIEMLFSDKSKANLEELLRDKNIAIKNIANIDFYILAQHLVKKRQKS